MTAVAAVTIAIPTFNGEEFLDEVLTACRAQDAPFPVEILVIDSGSKDRTLDIVRRHPGVWLVEIPNHEFGHGRTRNLAVGLAKGDVVVFLTQDATPAGRSWLQALLRPLADPAIAGVFGKQAPRADCCPTVKRDVTEAFRRPPAMFFSNVNSAVRRSVMETVPFRNVAYAEDLGFAADAADAGYRTVYAADAVVRHSHDLSIPDYFRRMYDEACGVRRSGSRPVGRGVSWLAAATVRGTVKDWRFMISDRDRGRGSTTRWFVKVPVYNAARRLAIWLAYRDRLSAWLEPRASLDSRRRRAAASPG